MKRVVVFSAFGQLVENTATEKEIPLSRLAHDCGIHLTTLRRGLEDRRGPHKPHVVRVLCDKLDIDHVQAYRLLGWLPPATEETKSAH